MDVDMRKGKNQYESTVYVLSKMKILHLWLLVGDITAVAENNKFIGISTLYTIASSD